MTDKNVEKRFSSGASITLKGGDCVVHQDDDCFVIISRAEILRFVQTVAAAVIEDACDNEDHPIASRTIMSHETCDDEE